MRLIGDALERIGEDRGSLAHWIRLMTPGAASRMFCRIRARRRDNNADM